MSLEVIELNLKWSGTQKHCTAINAPESCISEASSEFRRLSDDDDDAVKEGEESQCGCAAESSMQKSFLFQCMSET